MALPHQTTTCFSKPFSGESARVHLGGIYPLTSEIGPASWAAAGAGQPAVWFSGCSRLSVAILIRRMCSSTARLSRFTGKPPVKRGAPSASPWPLLRHCDNEDRGPGGRPGQSGWLPLLPGQSYESKGVAPLIRNLPFAALLADKALESNGVLGELQVHGAPAVILARANRQERRGYDKGAPTSGAI